LVIVALIASWSRIVKSSIDSAIASSVTVTARLFVRSPGANESVPTRAA
jgi:hypothetical protein